MTPTGLVFNVQRFSLHDGPGLRTTVFMKGCPLNCAWCHNPESQDPRIEYVRILSRCMRCGHCSENELANPVVRGRGDDDVDACPTGALQHVGRVMDPATLVAAVLRDRPFFEQSGGGVTFSGGEPLMQAAFVTESMRRLRAEGVHTALDTCGFAKWQDLESAASQASLVLYDLKLMDEARHRAVTGVSNHVILENLEKLTADHRSVWVRIPVIPGVNDDGANLEATAAYVKRLPSIRQVDLLPYHSIGEAKFARAGKDYALHGTTSPAPEHLDVLAACFRARGLHTTIGGHA
ncbi:MAG: glycyl-radical enzyme activating protein [Acidobacteriota bacterium]